MSKEILPSDSGRQNRYDKAPVIPLKYLHEDGSITSPDIGSVNTVVLPPSSDRVDLYNQSASEAVKYLLPNGSVIGGTSLMETLLDSVKPKIEMHIGTIGRRETETKQDGIFAKIPTPELLRDGDIVYMRHSTRRATHSMYRNVKFGKNKTMRIINNDHKAAPGGNPWFDNYAPIINPISLSVQNGKEYRWVKTGEIPNSSLVKMDTTKIWVGNQNRRTNPSGDGAGGRFTGENMDTTILDFVIVRNKVIIAESNKWLCKFIHFRNGEYRISSQGI